MAVSNSGGVLDFIYIDARFWQPVNAPVPMLVTLLGIVTLVRLLQPPNALLPMT